MSLLWAFSVSQQTCGIVELLVHGRKNHCNSLDYKLDDVNLSMLKLKDWQ